jgi:hypothetical protein
MFYNKSTSNHTFNATTDYSISELREFSKIRQSLGASYALMEYLQHTEAEADKIVTDPVYTQSDMKLIAAIGPMLASDLNLIIDSFYLDETPTEPTSCVEVTNRMVASFPSEPIVLTASNGNYSIYENGRNISHGLVRRLLRAKKFVQKCEEERLAAQEYYHSVWAYEKASLENDYQEDALQFYNSFEIADSAMSTNQLDASNTFIKYVASAKQNDLVTALVAMSFFGVCAIYYLRRPANCFRQGIASVIGLFKVCSKTRHKKYDEEDTPVISI